MPMVAGTVPGLGVTLLITACDSQSSVKESISSNKSGNMAPSSFGQVAEQLPAEEKNVVKKLLDAFLTMKHLQALAR